MADMHAFADFILETSALARRKKTQFNYRLESEHLKVLIKELDLSGLRKVSFVGNVAPAGKRDWLLTAELGATAVQPCTITLEPVTTRITAEVTRRFVAELPEYADESEEDEFGGVAMLEDDTIEPLEKEIDLWRVLSESLALEVPEYPRAEGAEIGTLRVTEPGKDAMSDDDLKPFAGLAALKDKLEGNE
ncbi:DUF177 domain-containing protein [Planktotalea sp.]|uniref:YceD family protein n=1 Tax=Planktotalea sp. TaxID=2029877 RepID=UPI003299092D